MTEPVGDEAPPRTALRRALETADEPLVIVAEGLRGLGSGIDWIARDAAGGAVLVLVAAAGDDLMRLAEAMAEGSWAADQLADWCRLAPGLGLDPTRGVRVRLLAAGIGPRTRAAAAGLPEGRVELSVWRRRPAGAGPLCIEPVSPRAEEPDARATPRLPHDAGPAPSAPAADETRGPTRHPAEAPDPRRGAAPAEAPDPWRGAAPAEAPDPTGSSPGLPGPDVARPVAARGGGPHRLRSVFRTGLRPADLAAGRRGPAAPGETRGR